jgi:hypothetical protein
MFSDAIKNLAFARLINYMQSEGIEKIIVFVGKDEKGKDNIQYDIITNDKILVDKNHYQELLLNQAE